ncbi:protein FLX-like 1 [Glycine soja]|uniref:protein FLX-like 1 n=1 Tax=Glycine soja TaxID=3848 RepID=UPI00103B41EA|nr:protein FLX-like 1 [Glycine soja]
MAAGGAESDVSAVVGGGSRSGVLVELAEVRGSQGTDVVGEARLAHSSSSSSSSSIVTVRALEERIEARHREIQALLTDNQRLARIHVAFKQDLVATQEELCCLSATVAEVKAERDAEVRGIAAMSSELDRVRADILELVAERKELTTQLHAVESELAKASTKAQFVPTIKADIEAMP